MANSDERKIARFKLLDAIYRATDGSENQLVDVWSVGQSIGLSQDDTINAAQYLVSEGLLAFRAIGGIVGLTHVGIVEYEQAETRPQLGTTHFPVNIINIAHMENSQIQQGNEGSTQSYVANPIDVVELARTVSNEVRPHLSELKAQGESAQDVEANLSTIEAQLQAKAPNPTILRESLKFFRDVASHLLSAAILAKLRGL